MKFQTPEIPSPSDALSLIRLRAMLDEARTLSRSASPASHLVAVILLDAVNERALHLAASTAKDAIEERASFDKLRSFVANHLGAAWQVGTHWREVAVLHRVRNLVQHQGSSPDRDQISAWRLATESFSKSLILASFGIDLDRVSYAHSINDERLKAWLIDADHALNSGDVEAGLRLIYKTFDSALSQWSRLAGSPPISRFIMHEFNEFREIENSFNLMRADVAGQVLGKNGAEYYWFKNLRSSQPRTITPEEAARALNFVYWWLVEWESISPDIAVDRWNRYFASQRRVRTGTELTAIHDVTAGVEVLGGGDHQSRTAVVTLTNLPPDEDFRSWEDSLLADLRKSGLFRYCSVSGTGEIHLSMDLEADLQRVGEVLATAVRAADDAPTRAREQAAKQEAERDLARQQQDAEYGYIMSGDPPSWLKSITLERASHLTSAFGLTIHVEEGAATALLGELNRALPESRCYSSEDSVSINPLVSASELKRLISSLSGRVTEAHRRLLNEKREAEARRLQAAARLRSVLSASLAEIDSKRT